MLLRSVALLAPRRKCTGVGVAPLPLTLSKERPNLGERGGGLGVRGLERRAAEEIDRRVLQASQAVSWTTRELLQVELPATVTTTASA